MRSEMCVDFCLQGVVDGGSCTGERIGVKECIIVDCIERQESRLRSKPQVPTVPVMEAVCDSADRGMHNKRRRKPKESAV